MYYYKTLNTFSEYPTITVDGEIVEWEKNIALYEKTQKALFESSKDNFYYKNTYQKLFSLKKQTEEAKLEYDATVSLIDSIKNPMRAEIKKKQDRLDKEFETLFNEIIKTEDSKKLIVALCS